MLQGLSNLARSAATVHLTGIEDMAWGSFPSFMMWTPRTRAMAAGRLACLASIGSRCGSSGRESRRPMSVPNSVERK